MRFVTLCTVDRSTVVKQRKHVVIIGNIVGLLFPEFPFNDVRRWVKLLVLWQTKGLLFSLSVFFFFVWVWRKFFRLTSHSESIVGCR